MSAEVETMMFTGRERPWHGLGTQVEEAPDSREALIAAGLDWDVCRGCRGQRYLHHPGGDGFLLQRGGPAGPRA